MQEKILKKILMIGKIQFFLDIYILFTLKIMKKIMNFTKNIIY